MLDKRGLADALNVSLATIGRMRSGGKLPAPIRLAMGERSDRWSRVTIERWIAEGCPDRKTFGAMTEDD